VRPSGPELFVGGADPRSPVVSAAVDPLPLEQLVLDQPVDLRLVAEQRTQFGDALLDVAVLVLHALTLESSQCTQTKLEDGTGLQLREVEALHQRGAGGVGV